MLHLEQQQTPIATPIVITTLMQELCLAGLDVIKTENLYNYDGKPGFSLGQGQ